MDDINNIHCCDLMRYYASSRFYYEHELIRYRQHIRAYNFVLHGEDAGLQRPVKYCPWCSTTLPKRLSEEWCAVIKEKFGLDEVFREQWKRLPKEFKTDIWWRKRGL